MGKLWRKTAAYAAALAIVLALALPVAAAPRAEGQPAAVQVALDWLAPVIDSARSGLAALWASAGEGLDPDGEPASEGASSGPVPTPEAGEGLDPDG